MDNKEKIGHSEWKQGMNTKRFGEIPPKGFKMRTCHSTKRAGNGGNDFEWAGSGERA